ncbi:helix-turn-helix domain-containing protein [Anabaena sp. UHCC 0253]|uniref:helix-turn-helix domain-containing protein n=1 Tax=Anabaena sp. UHCC 0253 TaxID=2590019 RepID=UPI00144696BC|nr:helix-turn-helix domain-containing protein [Anabaena sp. UHCC 0253]MTJ56058.1 helix-turn-helix domain-containing protein [Anabaena sp. UHCC 0253]
MAKEEKLRIFELFRKGVTVPEIEKTSSINRRTLYRWMQEYQSSQEPVKPLDVEIQEVKDQSDAEIELIKLKDSWVEIASDNSIRSCLANARIREKLSDILLDQLEEADLNLRSIYTLSQCISLHTKLEREMGMYELMNNPNLAMKILESRGYTIDNPSEELPKENIDLSGMSPEELSREYKKLLAAV